MKKNSTMLFKRTISLMIVLMCVFSFSATAQCRLLNENFDVSPVLSPTNVDGTWYPDRYRPAGFASAIFGGDNRLKISIDGGGDGAAARPPGQQGSFYNTQGRKFNQCDGCVTVAKGDLWIPLDWATDHRRSDMWATARNVSNAVSAYPIIGFRNPDGASPGIYCFDISTSLWINSGIAINYDSWYSLQFRLVGSNLEYLVDNVVVVTLPSLGSTYFGDIIMQAYNFNDPALPLVNQSSDSYDAYWDNIVTTGTGGNVVTNTNTGQTFCSIQAAIDAPLTVAGNTINVGAGSYNGNVTINKAITLRGSNAGVSGCSSRGIESTILNGAFNIVSNGVTIDGFEFTGTGARIASFGSLATWSNIAIVNNYIHATTAQQPILHGFGSGGGIGTTNWNVSNNEIEDIQSGNSTAIVLFNITNAVVNNNCISHTNTSFLGRRGINADGLQNAAINGNTINMGDASPTTTTNAPWAIQVSMSDRDAVSHSINGNTISNVYRAIQGLSQRNLTGLIIHNNDLTNVSLGVDLNTGGVAPVIPQPVQSGISIDNNNIVTVTPTIPGALGAGIRLRNLHSAVANGPVSYNGVDINENSFTVTVAAIIFESGLSISTENSTCNWYGTTNSAVVASKISGPVTYSPWLSTGGDGSTGPGFQPTGACDGTNVAPTITCPTDVTVQCASLVPPVNTAAVSTSGGCTGHVVTHVGDDITNQTCTNRYTINRVYMVTDACDNTAFCTQVITVYDNTPPTITCPPNRTVMPTSLAGTVVTYPGPTVSDNCGGTVTITRTGPASGSTFPIGTTTITYTATDVCGNTATCSFTITVIAYCDNKQKKVNVCHNGKTLCISINAVQEHLNHGDYLGPCTTSFQPFVTTEEPAKDELKVVVSPNPSSSNFSLQVISKSSEPISVRVMDLSGKVMTVNSSVLKGSIIKVGNELRAGTYIAEVIQGSNRQVVRLVKLD